MTDAMQKVPVELDPMVVDMLNDKARIAHLSFDDCLFKAVSDFHPSPPDADGFDESESHVTD